MAIFDQSESLPVRDSFSALLDDLRDAGSRIGAQADALSLTAAFFETMPIPSWIKSIGADGSITMLRVNKACEEAVGVSAEEYNNKSDTDIHGPEIAAKAEASDRIVIETNKPHRVDIIVFNHIKNKHIRLIGWKWRVPALGNAIAICGFGQEFPCQ